MSAAKRFRRSRETRGIKKPLPTHGAANSDLVSELTAIDLAKKYNLARGSWVHCGVIRLDSVPVNVRDFVNKYIMFNARPVVFGKNGNISFQESVRYYINKRILPRKNEKLSAPTNGDFISAIIEDDSYNEEDAVGRVIRAFVNTNGDMFPSLGKTDMPADEYAMLRDMLGAELVKMGLMRERD